MKTIVKYRKHPSVIAIVSEFTKEYSSFKAITIEDALKEISMFKSHAGYQHTSKGNKRQQYFFAEQNCAYFNESISKGKFPNCLKLANITPGFKTGARNSKNNYRPVNILPIFSKIFEKLLQKQLLVFFNNISSNFFVVFEKHMSRKAAF